MKKKQKIVLVVLVVVVVIIIFCYLLLPKFSKDNVGTYYKKSDGTYATNEWVKRFSDWYYFDGNGYMVKGQITPDEYYTDYKTGKMMKNYWLSVNGKYYYFDENGKFTRDRWIKYKNNYFYITSAGEMATNKWINNEFYVGQDGAMLVNAVTPDGNNVGEDGKVIGERKVQNQKNANSNKPKNTNDLIQQYYDAIQIGMEAGFDREGNLWIMDHISYTMGDHLAIYSVDGKVTTYENHVTRDGDPSQEEMIYEHHYLIDGEEANSDEVLRVIDNFYKYAQMKPVA